MFDSVQLLKVQILSPLAPGGRNKALIYRVNASCRQHPFSSLFPSPPSINVVPSSSASQFFNHHQI